MMNKTLSRLSKWCLAVGFIVVTSLAVQSYEKAMIFDVLMEGPLTAGDPRLLSYVRSRVLKPPGSGDYNLKIDHLDNPANRAYNNYLYRDIGYPPLHRILKAIFDDRPKGFFVEAGALDGEYLSNTLYLERDKGWKGLLVEPDSRMFADLLTKNRKAWSANCCLSTHSYPNKETLVMFSDINGLGIEPGFRAMNSLSSSPLANRNEGASNPFFRMVQCVPLPTLLKVLGVSHVDFVSLDIEGVEEDVLRNFMKTREGIEVDVWMVEHQNLKYNVKNGVDDVFVRWFGEQGYTLYAITKDYANYVFVRNASDIYADVLAKRPKDFLFRK